MAERALATAFVNIVPGTVDLENYLKTQLSGQVGAAGVPAGNALAKGVGSGFGSKIKGFLAPVLGTMVASFGALGAINFFKDSIQQSSDLNESLNAVNVTFGKNAAGIMDLGKRAATSVGLSRNEFNGLAVQFSAFAGTIAGKGGDVVGTIDAITKRGSDFASVMNLDVNQAMSLFQSGLAGETEPLRRYGIDLSAAAVQNYALANGIVHGKQQMTEAQKVQARYGLLMQATAKNAGDFANTSDQLANKTRITEARFKDAQAALGDNLRPAMLEVTNFANDYLVPAVIGVSSAFKWMADNGKIMIPVIAGIGAAILTALAPSMWAAVAATWAWTVALLANPMTWVVLGIGALIAAIVALAMNWDTVTKWVSGVWKGFLGWLTDGLNAIAKWWNDTWSGILKFFSDTWNNVVKFFKTTWDNVTSTLSGALTRIGSAISTGISNVVSFFAQLPGKVLGALGNLGSALYDTGRDLIQGLLNGAGSLLRNIGNFFLDMLPGWIRDPFKKALGIHSPSRVFMGYGENIVQGLIDGVESMQSPMMEAMRSLADATTEPMRMAIKGVSGDLVDLTKMAADRNVAFKALVENGVSQQDAFKTIDAAFGGQKQLDALLGQTTFLNKSTGESITASGTNFTQEWLSQLPTGFMAQTPITSDNGPVVNYYAAPNNSLSSEAALQQAMVRAKVVGAW